ncbi:MAG: Gfo/Idh/MocA family oxidoreductase [Pseudomonadota bacterium]
MQQKIRFVAIGLDHRHIFGQVQHMLDAGAECLGFWTDGTPETLAGFTKRFPDLVRFDTRVQAYECGPDLAVIAAVPADRAGLAIEAMEQGLDVMTDKPGCTDAMQLASLRDCVARTGRIWSIDFSERFEVPCATRASRLVAQGAIGDVVQTVGLGPHRLNRATRPEWFFRRARYGGILTDIASHQIDQFLHYCGVEEAEVTLARVGNLANPRDPELQDFGEIALASGLAQGYIRVDWFTPDGLPTWGDGRLTILGTDGYIELRKYVDVGGADGGDHLILANGKRCEKIDCSDEALPYFSCLMDDIRSRSETAMSQSHAFKVMELALKAQAMAEAQRS